MTGGHAEELSKYTSKTVHNFQNNKTLVNSEAPSFDGSRHTVAFVPEDCQHEMYASIKKYASYNTSTITYDILRLVPRMRNSSLYALSEHSVDTEALPTYLPTYPTTYLPTYLATYLPTYLPTYLGTCKRAWRRDRDR